MFSAVRHQSDIAGLLQGMSEDVSINRFFDDPMLLELVRIFVPLLRYALNLSLQASAVFTALVLVSGKVERW